MADGSPYKGKGETVYATEPIEERAESEEIEGPKYRDKEWLYYEYKILKKSAEQIADELGAGSTTINNWLERHQIEKREKGMASAISRRPDGKWRDEKWLRSKYVREGKSVGEIATEAETSKRTILQWLGRHRIPTREPNVNPPKYYEERNYTDEEWLRHNYLDLEKSTIEMADKCDVSDETIRRWLHRNGIPIRSRSENNRLRVKKEHQTMKKGGERQLVKADLTIDASWVDLSDRDIQEGWIPHEDSDWMERMYVKEGLSSDQIVELCNELGSEVSKSTIIRWLKRNDIDIRTTSEYLRQFDEEEIAQLRREYKEKDMTRGELSEKYSIHRTTVSKIINGHSYPNAPGPIKGENYE